MTLRGALADLDRQAMWQLNSNIAKRMLALFGALVFFGAPALAGDRAVLDVIGYSEDGRYFAFEEYGVQDGSGFAYSHIFVVDVVEDRWVIGTPIDVQADIDSTPLQDVRRTARDQAQPRLDSLHIYRAADVLAYIGSGAFDTKGLSLDFGVPNLFDQSEPDVRYTLAMEIFKTSSAAPCMDWFGEIATGFSLNLIDESQDKRVYADDILPRSRGCPVTYKIAGVYAPFQAEDLSRAMALISVFPRGFEGPDRRFIAVPIGNHF